MKSSKRNPWFFIPTQYFAEGLPYIIVNNLSVVLLKSLNAANDLIGYTSLLYLPWTLKPLWSPIVDGLATKRRWMLTMQFALAILFICAGFLAWFSDGFMPLIALLAIIAFVSATHDIATDGYYLSSLEKKAQAFFTGIRSTFYRLSIIFGSGILVIIAGNLGSEYNSIEFGWAMAFFIAAAIFVIFFIYHSAISPYPETDLPVQSNKNTLAFKTAFASYFKQNKIILIISFILLYRLGEGILVKMAQPFLMDHTNKGGLAIDISEVGFMYGTVGTTALVIGGILGGWIVKKFTLSKTIWGLALCMNLPNLLYVYLSIFKPIGIEYIDMSFIHHSWIFSVNPLVQICIALEQFGYGLGFTGFMIYLLYISKGEFRTSHYAISTGFMAVGMMLPGFISGALQMWLGYTSLFILSFLATIPGMIILFFIPKDIEN